MVPGHADDVDVRVGLEEQAQAGLQEPDDRRELLVRRAFVGDRQLPVQVAADQIAGQRQKNALELGAL